MILFKELQIQQTKTATIGKKLNGRLFRINGKPFRINGELFRVYGKLFHIDFSSCGGSFLAIPACVLSSF